MVYMYFYLQIHRSINYKKTVAAVDKWDPIVKFNREVSLSTNVFIFIMHVFHYVQTIHMKFPIQDKFIPLPSLQSKSKEFVVSQSINTVAVVFQRGYMWEYPLIP